MREGLGLYCEAIAADPAQVKQTDGSPLPAHSYALRVFREEGELRIDYVVF